MARKVVVAGHRNVFGHAQTARRVLGGEVEGEGQEEVREEVREALVREQRVAMGSRHRLDATLDGSRRARTGEYSRKEGHSEDLETWFGGRVVATAVALPP